MPKKSWYSKYDPEGSWVDTSREFQKTININLPEYNERHGGVFSIVAQGDKTEIVEIDPFVPEWPKFFSASILQHYETYSGCTTKKRFSISIKS